MPETDHTNDNKATRRSLFFKFCVGRYSELHRSGQTTTAPQVVREAIEIFGEDVRWSTVVIKQARCRHEALNLSLKSTDIPGRGPPDCCVCGRGCGRRPRRRWRCGGGAARDREHPARARRWRVAGRVRPLVFASRASPLLLSSCLSFLSASLVA